MELHEVGSTIFFVSAFVFVVCCSCFKKAQICLCRERWAHGLGTEKSRFYKRGVFSLTNIWDWACYV